MPRPPAVVPARARWSFGLLALVPLGVAALPRSQRLTTHETVTTLYRHDPFRNALSLETGEWGARPVGNRLELRDADLAFGQPEGGFQVGLSDDRLGQILDLGTLERLGEHYGYEEEIDAGRLWASIHFEHDALVVEDTESPDRSVELKEYDELMKLRPRTLDRREVRSGHVYLVRLTDRQDRSFERVAKILVLEHVPGESVTIRWATLSR